MSHKTLDHKTPAATRDAFLTTLYRDVPLQLWLEIRCIHPDNSKPHVLWSQINNKKQLEYQLAEAHRLNKSGYGIYFAPCLRNQRKGKAESAAIVPALWVDIDCEDDINQRLIALDKLQHFKPPPSIILNSGGGWHGYWLLDQPYLLESNENRQKISGILYGLFKVVGGDADYAKSVASLMRLPDFINTKEGRDNAIATITEFCPDRRYPLDSFDWLEIESNTIVPPTPILHVLNGSAPLPKVTQDYLAHGASNGNRNRSLFDAACQFRDAGYSQSEAEIQLVPRYVSDGTGNEQASARSQEAQKTIQSAYSQSPRGPITPTEVKRKVTHLIDRYQKQTQSDMPPPEVIAEAVKACAHLDALEWAEQRQKLKSLCGNGIRVSDLDRQYREARKVLEREKSQNYDESETYYEDDGRIIYRRDTYRGPVEKTVASWTGKVTERISQINDDGEVEHVASLQLVSPQQTVSLQVPSEMFGDDAGLRRCIAGRAGEAFTVRAGMGKHLAPAILTLSGDYPRRTCYRFMGWTQLDERWTYIAPGLSVNSDGIMENPPEIELDLRLRDYRLADVNWEDSLEAFKAMIPVFPKHLAPTCIAFALLPLVQKFFPSAAPRPAIHLAGTYGSGKSELAALMSSFYGTFSRDTPPAQWGDTINTVEALGYPLASALFWVDDYKNIYADEKTFTRFLQSYSRGMGRGRLTREAKVRQERPCRGLILSTGETMLEGEASVLSRMLVLDVPPWEHRDPQGQALAQADALRHNLVGFTVKFASWIADQADQHDLSHKLSHSFGVSVKGYRDKLKVAGVSMSNTGRVIQNWSVLVTVYRLLREFLSEFDADDCLPAWNDVIVETARIVRQERASEVFLNSLSQLLASGEVMLASNTKNPEEPRPGTILVGYRDTNYVYLLPEIAFRTVNRIQQLKFTVSAIGSQLKEDGWLIPGNSSNHLTVQLRIRDGRVRLWRIKSDILCGDSGVSGDELYE